MIGCVFRKNTLAGSQAHRLPLCIAHPRQNTRHIFAILQQHDLLARREKLLHASPGIGKDCRTAR